MKQSTQLAIFQITELVRSLYLMFPTPPQTLLVSAAFSSLVSSELLTWALVSHLFEVQHLLRMGRSSARCALRLRFPLVLHPRHPPLKSDQRQHSLVPLSPESLPLSPLFPFAVALCLKFGG